MPQVKKKSDVTTSMVKSVFLYGHPNAEKRDSLIQLESLYTNAINQYIDLLNGNNKLLLPLLKNSKKDTEMRAFEKAHCIKALGSAYSQNAFDDAVTMLSNRLLSIKTDVSRQCNSIFARLLTLYYCVLTNKSRSEMISMLEKIRDEYKLDSKKQEYQKIIDDIKAMPDAQFNQECDEVRFWEMVISATYKVPHVKKASVRLDDRVAALEESTTAKTSHVVSISVPKELLPKDEPRGRIEIPVNTSKNSIRRMKQYGVSKGMLFSVRPDGTLRVSASFEKKPSLLEEEEITQIIGADVGISDCIHTSEDGAFGSFSGAIEFYKNVAEPLEGEIATMRNKKATLKHYLQKHKKGMPEEVIKAIRDKMDHLENNIRHARKVQRAVNRYHNMVEQECRKAVDEYIASLHGNKSILTAIELLDIREFNKGRKMNGKYSMFARGLLSKTLMDRLNWLGYRFVQVDPAYTSQTCPVCSFQSGDNRNGKVFHCLCCGYHADADHVGGINIKARVEDMELNTICERHQNNQTARHKAYRKLFAQRNQKWKELHPDKVQPQAA